MAIRVGESVVVVNLHRAKVEEIEMEPPPHKKRCVRSRRPSHHNDVDYLESSSSTLSAKHSSSSRDHYRYLNTNHSASDMLGARNYSPPSTHHHRSSRRKVHRTLGKNHDLLESRHHHPSHNSSAAPPFPMGQPDRSMLTYTRDTPMETSVALSAPPPMESPSHAPIPRATPIISKDAPVLAPPSPPQHEVSTAEETKADQSVVGLLTCSSDESMEVVTELPELTGNAPTAHCETTACAQDVADGANSPPPTSPPVAGTLANEAGSADSCCCRKHNSVVSRSIQTDPEPLPREKRQGVRAVLRRDNKVSNRKLPESGISMKRKAVMEAISEILKKMYANTEKGRLPGSFKGRFSSEFTCDSDMREILHSKTTMTSYGSEVEGSNKSGTGDPGGSDALNGNGSHLSKAKLEEHQQIKDKVADLKWRMQHKRALKMAKRKGERSPCGWMEALNCDMPGGEPKPSLRSGYCGLKRGFLLAD